MKPVTTGILVAAAIIVAFVVGMQIELERDGPLEKLGESVEKLADEAEK